MNPGCLLHTVLGAGSVTSGSCARSWDIRERESEAANRRVVLVLVKCMFLERKLRSRTNSTVRRRVCDAAHQVDRCESGPRHAIRSFTVEGTDVGVGHL